MVWCDTPSDEPREEAFRIPQWAFRFGLRGGNVTALPETVARIRFQ